jgi:hypothetical protein
MTENGKRICYFNVRDVNKVRTMADEIKLLVSKVYHHFKEVAALGQNANN